jgi:hypothetical protein
MKEEQTVEEKKEVKVEKWVPPVKEGHISGKYCGYNTESESQGRNSNNNLCFSLKETTCEEMFFCAQQILLSFGPITGA